LWRVNGGNCIRRLKTEKRPVLQKTSLLPRLVCILGTSDFDAQISGIKFWKGDENLRPVYKRPFYGILSGWFLG
jgi:hypothetical protein